MFTVNDNRKNIEKCGPFNPMGGVEWAIEGYEWATK